MSSIRKIFTCPPKIWNEFKKYLDSHPEVKLSGWIQERMKQFNIQRQRLEERCKYFKNGYCQTDSSINECSLLTQGVCYLEMGKIVQVQNNNQSQTIES